MSITKRLLDWYDNNKRDLPWRQTKDPYAIWVSEIMLQQTRVDTAIEYYKNFLDQFKTVKDLAQADEQQVLNVWKGLGYYSRARNMHRTAKEIYENHKGVFPNDLIVLQKLPGIGRYTAAAIASIAYGVPAPAVDGNALRVISRVLGIKDDISNNNTKNKVAEKVEGMIDTKRAGDFTQALMELGATLCLPQKPACETCPVREDCFAYKHNLTDCIPYKAPKKSQNPIENYWTLVIQCNNKLLMEYRKKHNLLKNMWGLPMIVAENNDKIIEFLQNEFSCGVYEEKGIVQHVFTHKVWKMYVLAAKTEREVKKEGLEWIDLKDLNSLPIPTAFKKVIEAVF